MSVITLFSGAFCQEEPVIEKILARTGYRRVADADAAAEASRLSGVSAERIVRAFGAKTSVFNKFTHDKERAVAFLRLAAARMLAGGDGLLIEGFTGLLIPAEISHVLKVCLIADLKSRVEAAGVARGLDRKDATRTIRKLDEDRAAWTDLLFERKDPWHPTLYDIVIPTDKMSADDAAKLVEDNLAKDVVKTSKKSDRAAADFLLAAEVGAALAREGHDVTVRARGGKVAITIEKHVLMLSRLEEELKEIAGRVEGVQSVETKVGKNFHRADIYRRFDFEVPSKVLLVDDEREFVQTLSERLLMRDMGSAVAYDGESALDMVREDEPDVIILDLKMPGIDGIEVLKRVKATNPEVEVIILTGHGSEADRDTCMRLGAFAYLRKPVDIDVLSEKLKEANEAIRRKKREKP